MYIYIDYNTYTRIPQYSLHVFLARRGQGLLGMFVCLFVCLFVGDSPSLGASYVRLRDGTIHMDFFPKFFFWAAVVGTFFSTTPALTLSRVNLSCGLVNGRAGNAG